jgi:3-oxoadipate enol-lactonase
MSEVDEVDLGGVRMAYRETGDPANPPALLLHGLGSESGDWDTVAAGLADVMHVYALDLRGHGKTQAPQRYSFELMRDDVLRFVEVMGLPPVTLVGHSMGGTVAYLVAQHQPAAVARLVLVDSPPPSERDDEVDVPDGPEDDVVVAILGQLNRPDPRWWRDADTVTCPTLVLAGGPTSHVPQERLAELAAVLPDAQLVNIPGGHRIHELEPAALIDAVRTFLAR